MRVNLRIKTSFSRGALAALVALAASACGDVNINDGDSAGFDYCEDRNGQYHFQALIPPWKYNKEYRCDGWTGRQCTGGWSPTGRFIFIVSDAPFVNYDSEIITSLEVTSDETVGPQQAAWALIQDEEIGLPTSRSQFFGDATEYPRAVEADDENPFRMEGFEVLWRQERDFESRTFNWYRRDVWLVSNLNPGRIFHLKFFSIDTLDKPEFELLLNSFRDGMVPSDQGTPENCQCIDEHDPLGPQDC